MSADQTGPAGDGSALRLTDAQWVNIVNHAHCYRDMDKEEAVALAVKLTEARMAMKAKAAAPAAAPAAVPMCSEQAVMHAVSMAQSEAHKQGDVAFWHAFARAMWRQFNAMAGAQATATSDGS